MSENGILGLVPGEYIALASRSLPDPATAQILEHQVEIDAGHAGRVRLFIHRMKASRGEHSHFYWSAYRAEAVVAGAGSDIAM
jgi:hypothetical protein